MKSRSSWPSNSPRTLSGEAVKRVGGVCPYCEPGCLGSHRVRLSLHLLVGLEVGPPVQEESEILGADICGPEIPADLLDEFDGIARHLVSLDGEVEPILSTAIRGVGAEQMLLPVPFRSSAILPPL